MLPTQHKRAEEQSRSGSFTPSLNFLYRSVRQQPVEHGDDLRAGTRAFGIGWLSTPPEDTGVNCPCHSLTRVSGHLLETIELTDRHAALGGVHTLRFCEAVEHDRHLVADVRVLRDEPAAAAIVSSV